MKPFLLTSRHNNTSHSGTSVDTFEKDELSPARSCSLISGTWITKRGSLVSLTVWNLSEVRSRRFEIYFRLRAVFTGQNKD